ncbi:uncharacterized protein LOC127796637 [Diospyros lotus]|uniref:uncharacterized protein LOC127796637 n=1 Tax=Diospyros lotus TaxID=55363 RepID=UPI00225B80E4|nr:uncharacterized protein LOC127796637 [Diospyros lotus]
MMSLGFSNAGGSSSSSNLSPLAPPFTKTNSNQLVNFTELPNAIPFHSSLGSWQYSHSSPPRPDLFSNIDLGVDSIRTTCLPSADYYGYVGSHPASSPNTHVPPLNPNISTATKTFTFSQHSSDMPRNHVEIEPYYSSSLSPVVADDDPLVAINEPSYDSLSASSVVPLLGSAETDYNDRLSGLEYTPQWGGFCSLDDREQCKRVEVNGSFCSDGTSVAASNVYNNYIKQGAGPSGGLSKREEAQAVSHRRHVNGLGIESQVVSPSAEKFNYKSSSLQDPSIISGESSKISISGSLSIQEFLDEAVTDFCNYQSPYASYDKSFQQFDSCMNDCLPMKNSLPATDNRLVSIGSTVNVPITVSSEYVNSVGNFSIIKSNGFGHCYSSNGKEPHLSQSSGKEVCLDTSRLNLPMERGAVKQEELLNQPVSEVLDQMPKSGIIFELPNITIPDGFNLAIDGSKGYTATEESSEILDHYNPAVDSPCWKGVPTSRFTPSGGSEAVSLQNLKKKSEACKSSNLQQTQIFPPCSGDTMKTSSYSLCENSAYSGNGYVELGSLLSPDRLSNANCSAREQGLADALEAGFNFHKSQFGNELKLYDDIKKHREEYGIPNSSRKNLELNPSHTKQPSFQKGDVTSGRESKLGSGDEESGLNVNNTLKDCSMESIACLPLEEDDRKLCQPYPAESTPKMNVQMLVNTMHNLSELLLFHCSNDTSSLSGQNCEALKHVINNLDACLPKRFVHANSARESTFSQGGASSESRKLPDLNKDVSTGRYNADVTKANNTVQAIKEVLKEDFSGEEETHTETLMFKNLWLEAEAALCSTSYRARFNRVKIEMDKSKFQDTKETTETVEKTLSSKFSPDPNLSLKATAEAKDGSLSKNFIQGSPDSSATKTIEKLPSSNDSPDHYRNIEVSSDTKDSFSSDNLIQESPVSNRNKIIDDVEASVMARFHILKYRGQNSNSGSSEGQQSEESVNSPYMQEQDGPHSQNSDGPHSEHETEKELLVSATDDHQVIRPGIQLPSGWSDSSSSDWEHV